MPRLQSKNLTLPKRNQTTFGCNTTKDLAINETT
jgi:hypothetical protein